MLCCAWFVEERAKDFEIPEMVCVGEKRYEWGCRGFCGLDWCLPAATIVAYVKYVAYAGVSCCNVLGGRVTK